MDDMTADLMIERSRAEALEKRTLNRLTAEIHRNAVEHGWWDEPRTFGEIVALCHSELSEALEEYRNGQPLAWAIVLEGDDDTVPRRETDPALWTPDQKPEGIAVEMIDCIIRILDWCGHAGVDVEQLLMIKHEYNKGRPYKHGGKRI